MTLGVSMHMQHNNSSRVHIRMMLAAKPVELASATKAASTIAEGWLRRKVGVVVPFTGSQSMRNPPERTDRVRAHSHGVHSGRSLSLSLAQVMAGGGSLFLPFACFPITSPRPLRLGGSSAGPSRSPQVVGAVHWAGTGRSGGDVRRSAGTVALSDTVGAARETRVRHSRIEQRIDSKSRETLY
jgi:hypothetical protein